jgi:hypothetical protein
MHTRLGEALPVVELGLVAKDADRDRPTSGTLSSLLEFLDPCPQLLGRLVTARGDLSPGASEFGQREWRERAAALVSYLRREGSFRFLTGRSSPATIASMEERSSVGRRAGDCLVAHMEEGLSRGRG